MNEVFAIAIALNALAVRLSLFFYFWFVSAAIMCKLFTLLFLIGLTTIVTGFGGNDDRFIKKYAMMKVSFYVFLSNIELVMRINRDLRVLLRV